MESQFYTRNAMTGWVVLIAFGIVYVGWPGGLCWAQLWELVAGDRLAVFVSALVALLGSLVLGSGTAAWVRLWMRLWRGHPYWGTSRVRLRDGLLNDQLRPFDVPKLPLEWGSTRRWLDPLFAYMLYTYAEESFTSFARRQHTGRFLGANWLGGTITGGSVGALAHLLEPWATNDVNQALLLGSAFVGLFVFPQWLNGWFSHIDVERAERLWVQQFLRVPEPATHEAPPNQGEQPEDG